MWKYILEKIDAKLITAGGGIILAGFVMYVLWNLVGNHIDHATRVQQETNKALLEQAVTNVKVASAVDNLSKIIEKKIK